ncbi:MAG: prolyl oligopeptidase family serine peptidase [Candidatus Hinthialibacter antarcticus]|nr:prolyl oligopeptidase family serine peptidase [Candidatus Hinthialibacter antarcticus]
MARKNFPLSYLLFNLLLITGMALTISAANTAEEETIQLTQGVGIDRVGRSGRSAIRTDPVEYQIVTGTWVAPKEGDVLITGATDEPTWQKTEADEDGWFQGPGRRRGYISVNVHSDSDRMMLLNGSGHSMVYVNQVPRMGDVYGYGYSFLPVRLNQGDNEFLFQCSRGRLKASLVTPSNILQLNDRDMTLPDLVVGEDVDVWGGIIVIQPMRKQMRGLFIRASLEQGGSTLTPAPPIQPMSAAKVPFRIISDAPVQPGKQKLQIELLMESDNGLSRRDFKELTLDIREPTQSRKRTFISDIDGSVQYYAVQPANRLPGGWRDPALVLSLHGASVEAINQANAYSSKTWAHIVAPTNRRPYGFDWEEWGRMDALEVLGIAKQTLHTDPARTYLTGHSMGGHGTWQVGVHFPDQFAAIAPSAGWISFFSYVGRGSREPETEIGKLIQRSSNASDTLAMKHNYAQEGVYILHGGADDNVPASQAQTMVEELSGFHRDFVYHEEPGQGHWWNLSDENGADCVDWAPMFDFFARHALPSSEQVRRASFTTVNPGVSAKNHWATIFAQEKMLEPSAIDIQFDPYKRRFVGETKNVSRLSLDVSVLPPNGALMVSLDQQEIADIRWPWSETVNLEKQEGEWSVVDKFSKADKGPHRYGPFKQAFRNRMVFVYGTRGSSGQSQWAFNKARYDAEQFWYRGNASVPVIADNEFDPADYPDRNVVLYGNANSNLAWKKLLADCPVQVNNGSVTIGAREIQGSDLACLFMYPRQDSKLASVAVVSGSGLVGMKLTDRCPYFTSGVGYPDVTVLTPGYLKDGAEGIVAAGFFGMDWGVESGEFVFQDD